MLRRSPCRTPRLLAANRSNARKSTGPRTLRGKARVSLNALRHGRYAAATPAIRQRLTAAGYHHDEALCAAIRERLFATFYPQTVRACRDLDRLAASVWLSSRKLAGLGEKPECALDSVGNGARMVHRTLIRVQDRVQRRGLSIWVQRRRYWTRRQIYRLLTQPELPLVAEAFSRGLESGLRCMVYRLRRPSVEDQLRFGLDKAGHYHPERVAKGRRILKALGGTLKIDTSQFYKAAEAEPGAGSEPGR